MTYQQALDYISAIGSRAGKPGLGRIETLMAGLGNVQDGLKFVHLAGTNGKGSTSCMLASVLQKAGYKTGLFVSPYIIRFNERMQINGRHIPDEKLAEIVARIKPIADAMEGCTEFELITAAAFVWFAEENCDIVVLETGLGGRLDATNIIKSNECAIITNIGIDHTDYLGNTIEDIAYEKACILKDGCPVVAYASEQGAMDVLTAYAMEHNNPMTVADFDAIESVSADLTGQSFRYKGSGAYSINLLGPHQLKNAAVVLETVETLRKRGWRIPHENVREGLRDARWPARFELLHSSPIVFVDGAHNMQGVESLRASVEQYLGDKRIVCLTGVLADKDWQRMMEVLEGFADHIITVTPDSPRALTAEALAGYLSQRGKWAWAAESVQEGMDMAIARALETDSVIVACGSLYMAGEIRTYFGRNV
ncbi:MAG: bifunctional folylpolyglutamate synthase/dihydrofolate synthase [Oscillospiraceae bacterium]|nr:bifunctional folylpolyglutamate synthase/dihydrofolate synthase [Oscillospiraceae bacterium]